MNDKVRLAVKKPGNKEQDTVSNKPKPDISQPVEMNSPVEQVLQLQRTIGNQAVTRLIQSGALQAKLKIGQPDDMYEKEADRVAEQVMLMSEGSLVNGHWSLGRKESEPECPECREEEKEISKPEINVDLRQVNMLINSQAANTNRSIIARCTIDGPSDIIRRLQLSETDITDDNINFDLSLPLNLLNIGSWDPGFSPFVIQNGQYLFPPHIGISPPFSNFPFVFDGFSTTESSQGIGNPLDDMSTFQAPGGSGWWGAIFGCYRNTCTKEHEGWDIYADVGTDCKAVVDGTITHAEQSSGAGDYVILTSSSDSNKKYYYMHLSSREPVGQVTKGDKVGKVGTSGYNVTTRPHLHFAVKESGTYVDPDGKGFTKPTSVRSANGVVTTIDYSEQEPCTPCS